MPDTRPFAAAVPWARVEQIVDAALDSDSDDRQALVERLAGSDAAVRDAALEWLRGCARADGFLDTPRSGSYIGPWRVLKEIGRGGMGVVYLVERPDAELPMRAALKRQRDAGVFDPHRLRRFREERRILAQLQHPGIARLLDGGVGADGAPWFAMEYVDGVQIDEWCRANNLDLRARVRLMLRVLDAVQHAHTQLVVHRDLKPANVLVGHDGTPRLLDFGVAKLLSADSTAHLSASSTLTRAQSAPMSLPYAAPEQLREQPVSIATDVYALGVMLYELLTGALPFGDGSDGRSALEARILAGEPARPSRRVEPRGRGGVRVLRGDLDHIVLRAMHLDPSRRYASAAALADDLRAWLDGFPVSARPDSVEYRLRKFVQRHPVPVSALLLLLATLVLFTVSTARQARRLAVERENAEQVTRFLTRTLTGSDVHTMRDGPPSIRELLDDGARRAMSELAARPEVRGNLLMAIAPVYFSLGEWDRELTLLYAADSAFREAYGTDDDRRLSVLNELAQVEMKHGSAARAEQHVNDALRLLGTRDEHRGTRRDALLGIRDAAWLRQGRVVK